MFPPDEEHDRQTDDEPCDAAGEEEEEDGEVGAAVERGAAHHRTLHHVLSFIYQPIWIQTIKPNLTKPNQDQLNLKQNSE